MTSPMLAAIPFDTQDVDGFLGDISQSMKSCGLTVRGVVQSRGAIQGECRCADMDLTSLGSRQVFRISQPLGNGSRGCRLHLGSLAVCAAHLQDQIAQGADLLVLNRFGRGESEGRGFRDVIAQALGAGIPVLTAVRPTYWAAWRGFAGDAAVTLPMTHAAVFDWFQSTREICDAV
ncbi:DUF2478 domain-containing protein [Roseovarius sp. 2305UL8-3]|uniref:DUF2478 domain-containing protein n=1 Tax=Roseovarius conchicola TaxID=3121636 RepID=UPI003529A6F0